MVHVRRYLVLLQKFWEPRLNCVDLHQLIGGALTLSPADVITIEARLIWLQILRVDLTKPWDVGRPLYLLTDPTEALDAVA